MRNLLVIAVALQMACAGHVAVRMPYLHPADVTYINGPSALGLSAGPLDHYGSSGIAYQSEIQHGPHYGDHHESLSYHSGPGYDLGYSAPSVDYSHSAPAAELQYAAAPAAHYASSSVQYAAAPAIQYAAAPAVQGYAVAAVKAPVAVPTVQHVPAVADVPVTKYTAQPAVVQKQVDVAKPAIKTRKYEVRRPALQKQFYDIEERIIIRPAGSAVVELASPLSKTQRGPAVVTPVHGGVAVAASQQVVTGSHVVESDSHLVAGHDHGHLAVTAAPTAIAITPVPHPLPVAPAHQPIYVSTTPAPIVSTTPVYVSTTPAPEYYDDSISVDAARSLYSKSLVSTVETHSNGAPYEHHQTLVPVQHAVVPTQHTILATQHSVVPTQHTVLSAEHAIVPTQHAVVSTVAPILSQHVEHHAPILTKQVELHAPVHTKEVDLAHHDPHYHEDQENQRRLLNLLTAKGGVAEVGFGHEGHGSYDGDTGLIRARVLSATPSPHAEPSGERVHTRRIVVSRPIETIQEVEVNEPVTKLERITVNQPTVIKTAHHGVERVHTSVPVYGKAIAHAEVGHAAVPVGYYHK